MSNKVLVTKEFHRKALLAIEKVNKLEALQSDEIEMVRMAWMSYMENHYTEEQIEHFTEYCEQYAKELGFDKL